MNSLQKTPFLSLAALLLAAWATSAIAADGAFEERLTIDGPIVLDVSTGSGSIEINPGPGNEAFIRGEIHVNKGGLFSGRRGDKDEIVQAVLDNPPIELDNGLLRIGRFDDRGLGKRVSISYVITIPAGTETVASSGSGSISVVDIEKQERVRVIDLGGPDVITQARQGERVFHSAARTFARQFSCHSCHPDGHVDGITYDIEPDGLGINPVDNRTLRGIFDTAPFKWEGTNPTLQRQCGPRLAAFFTRIDPFTPEQSAALERYIVTIRRPPNRYRTGEELTPAQRRGKVIFEREYDKSGNRLTRTQRCVSCHAPPYFTNREVFDVGTASSLDTHSAFDVPHLNNIYDSAPYLHDGRAQSLDEIWTVYNPRDLHGFTNDLTKDELNDLIEYLMSL